MNGNCCGDCVTPNQSSSHVFSHAEKMFLTFSHIWLCTSIKNHKPTALKHPFLSHAHPYSCSSEHVRYELSTHVRRTVYSSSSYSWAIQWTLQVITLERVICRLRFDADARTGFQHCRERCRASVSNPEQTHACKLYQLVPTAGLHAKPRGDVDRRSLQRVMLSLFKLLTGRG